jgi:SAM-dependent methyltransferase
VNPLLYDWECEHVLGRSDDDTDWLIGLAKERGGPILELACGSGRVTVPLAAGAGLPVVGLDVDREMLLGARAKGARALVQADMRSFRFGCRFPLAAVPYNSLQLVDDAGAMACMLAVADHLEPGGAIAVECTDFQRDVVTADVGDEELGRGRLPTGESVVLTGSLAHDLAARTSIYRRRFTVDGVVYDHDIVIRSISAPELVALMEGCGVTVETVECSGPRTRCVGTVTARPEADW